MPTYQDIIDRVALILVNANPDVAAALPRLVFEAHVELERRYAWRTCEGELRAFCSPTSNDVFLYEVGPSLEGLDRAFLRLRDDKGKRPYLIPLDSNAVVTDDNGATTSIQYQKPAIDKQMYLQLVTPELPVVGDVLEFTTVVTSGWKALQGRSGVIFLLISELHPEGGYYIHQVFLQMDLTGISTIGPTDASMGDSLRILRGGKDRRALEWIEQPDVRRFYGGTQVAQRPQHLFASNADALGRPTLAIYPTPDASYEIRVPCLLSLLRSNTDLPSLTTDNWMTNLGFRALIAMAAAEALLLERDDQRAALWAQRAEREIGQLIAMDKRARVTTDSLLFSEDPRGPVAARPPRW